MRDVSLKAIFVSIQSLVSDTVWEVCEILGGRDLPEELISLRSGFEVYSLIRLPGLALYFLCVYEM